jgi:hypothetical protein
LNNMTIALLSFTKRWVVRNSLLLVIWIFGIGRSHHLCPYQLFDNFSSLFANLFFPHNGHGCLYGCKLEWCPCFLEGRNRCKHHMYLQTHELYCNSYMPRWTLRGVSSQKELWNKETIPLSFIFRT